MGARKKGKAQRCIHDRTMSERCVDCEEMDRERKIPPGRSGLADWDARIRAEGYTAGIEAAAKEVEADVLCLDPTGRAILAKRIRALKEKS